MFLGGEVEPSRFPQPHEQMVSLVLVGLRQEHGPGSGEDWGPRAQPVAPWLPFETERRHIIGAGGERGGGSPSKT